MNKLMISSIASLGLVLGSASIGVAQTPYEVKMMQPAQTAQDGQFHRIEQPLANKAIVTLGGLGLISLELWWFLLSKPKPRKTTSHTLKEILDRHP